MDRGYKRETYQGFGAGHSRAFELALTPVIFGAVGYGLDRWFGIVPVLTIVFVLFALVGTFVKMWYGYDREMREIEAKSPWKRPSPEAAP